MVTGPASHVSYPGLFTLTIYMVVLGQPVFRRGAALDTVSSKLTNLSFNDRVSELHMYHYKLYNMEHAVYFYFSFLLSFLIKDIIINVRCVCAAVYSFIRRLQQQYFHCGINNG